MPFTFEKQMYINGALLDGGASCEVVNPASETVVGSIAAAGKTETQAALLAAKNAAESWAATPVPDRIEWMNKLLLVVKAHAEHLKECVHVEMGKPWSSAQEDVDALVNSLSYYAEEILNVNPQELPDRDGTHVHTLYREPIGVVGAFLAWNYPLLNLAYKLGPAMAAGCPIIIKPSKLTPLSAYAVGELCAEIGLPPGVVNIIAGDDQLIGDTISASTIPSMLTLIGSTKTGRHIIRNGATSIKRYSMELGGNAPALIFADADLDQAADTVCAIKFSNAGQICVTPNRVYVEASVADVFTQKIVDRANAVKVGFGDQTDIDMGPVVDGSSWQRIDTLVNDATQKGATLLTGGGRPTDLVVGHYYAPTVLSGVTPAMRIYTEEVFGPVVSLMTFTDEASVLAAANDTDAGLSSFIFTKDLARADRIAAELRFGEVQINGVKYGIDLPHCGVKQSGIGVDCSHLALDDYLVPKRVSRALTA